MILRIIYAFLVVVSLGGSTSGAEKVDLQVDTAKTLAALEKDEDTDGDKRITVNDSHIEGTERGDKRFWIKSSGQKHLEVSGTYYLSNLLQELSLASEAGLKTARLNSERIFEPPVDRISRSIRELYWDGLTRRIDEEGLVNIQMKKQRVWMEIVMFTFRPPIKQRTTISLLYQKSIQN
jgi:alpha,alpha-trehalase